MKNFKYLVLAICAFAITSCATGPKISSGSIVKVDYKGTLKDGTVFDTTEGKKPLAFLVGSNQVIPAFEEAVASLGKGQSKKFTIKAEDAYGEADPKKIVTLPKDDRFKGVDLKAGTVIFANNKTPEGKSVQTPMKVVSVADKEVTMDYNHPLAGEDLTFNITLVEVKEPATPEATTEPQAQATEEAETNQAS